MLFLSLFKPFLLEKKMNSRMKFGLNSRMQQRFTCQKHLSTNSFNSSCNDWPCNCSSTSNCQTCKTQPWHLKHFRDATWTCCSHDAMLNQRKGLTTCKHAVLYVQHYWLSHAEMKNSSKTFKAFTFQFAHGKQLTCIENTKQTHWRHMQSPSVHLEIENGQTYVQS